MYREAKIRATNVTFIFWDLFYPLGYLLVFGVGMNAAMGFTPRRHRRRLQRVLPRRRARHGELRHRVEHRVVVLHGSRQRHLLRDAHLSDEPGAVLLGKVLFNVGIALVQALLTVVLSGGSARRAGACQRAAAAAWRRSWSAPSGWFFFYAMFALRIRRNDAFNTVTSVFYFVFLFASSMFYPLEPLPRAFRFAAAVNPITWHVDVMRYATIGVGTPGTIALEAVGFVMFTLVAFWVAVRALGRE